MSEARLQDLEMKVTFLDDTVSKLDTIITLQQLQIEELKQQLKHNHKQLNQLKQLSKEQIGDEPPPHY